MKQVVTTVFTVIGMAAVAYGLYVWLYPDKSKGSTTIAPNGAPIQGVPAK